MNLHEPGIASSGDLFTFYKPGHSLTREFYTSPAIYERDLERVWGRNWIWAGHASQVAEPGDFFLLEFGYESIIITRARDGRVHAHLNVCRHRGSRVCLEKAGRTSSFTCPYHDHAWTYNLDGSLRNGRVMPDGFDPAAYGLRPVHLIDFQGLLFICLAETLPDIAPTLAELAPWTAPFGFKNMKVAHEASYPIPANWKLAEENYRECYHCAPSHLDYSKSHSLKDETLITPELMAAMDQRSLEVGLPNGTLHVPSDGSANFGVRAFYRRYPLLDGYLTGSEPERVWRLCWAISLDMWAVQRM